MIYCGSLSLHRHKWSQGYDRITRLHAPEYDVFSPGAIRNFAAKHANGKYIFFVYAVLDLSHNNWKTLICKLQKIIYINQQAFLMYPCLYLTKEETERFDRDFQGCLESFLRGENHRVEGIALASSCLLMNREWFLLLGSFDEQFVGHGGEDLELIDRLTRHYTTGPRPDDYALNIKAQHPGIIRGCGAISAIMRYPICLLAGFWCTSGIRARLLTLIIGDGLATISHLNRFCHAYKAKRCYKNDLWFAQRFYLAQMDAANLRHCLPIFNL